MIAGYRFSEDKEHEEGLRAVESVNEVFSTGMKLHLIPLPMAKVRVVHCMKCIYVEVSLMFLFRCFLRFLGLKEEWT